MSAAPGLTETIAEIAGFVSGTSMEGETARLRAMADIRNEPELPPVEYAVTFSTDEATHILSLLLQYAIATGKTGTHMPENITAMRKMNNSLNKVTP